MQSIWHICVLAACAASAASNPARLYEITIETGMPHLEENLRYAITRSRQFLARNDLGSAFPILDHPSLAGCKLREQQHAEDMLLYVLVCEGSAETTGTARWQLGERVIRGTLDVKLGGKNMTLYQRVTGTLIDGCPPAGASESSG
ncbi:MAG TPA: hypothetical protein VGE08_08460 [Steroidobacter sp.]|uniref:hypothetical protein n=1 Tax=Steroidobacter sp. TaxID=1978227 RepID=UPI002EDBADB5